MFVIFSRLYGHFKSLASFRKWRGQTLHQAVKSNALVNFAKLQILSNNFSKKCSYFDEKARTNMEADTYATLYQLKSYHIDMSTIKITIKSNQIDMDVCFFQK